MNLLDIYDHLSDVVILLDDKQQILAANREALRYFNCTKAALLGQSYQSACQSRGLEPMDLAKKEAATKTRTGHIISWRIINETVLIGKILNESDSYLSSIVMQVMKDSIFTGSTKKIACYCVIMRKLTPWVIKLTVTCGGKL